MNAVNIEVPASAPASIPKPEGNVAACESFATTLFRASGRFEQVGDTSDKLSNVDGWLGDSFDVYQAAARTTGSEHRSMMSTVERVARSVTAYGDNLSEHLVTWETLRDTKASLDRNREELIEAIRQAKEATPGDIYVLQMWSSALKGDYATLVSDNETLQKHVRENETLMRQAFSNGTTLKDALSDLGGVSDAARTAMAQSGAPGTGASAEQVNEWWRGLSDAEREAVIAAYPNVIGQADGLPASVRDEANRILLDDDLATLAAQEADGTLSSDEAKALENARATQRALADADKFTDPITGERVGAQLWLYDPTDFGGDGRVAIAVGDLDQATDVSLQIPGITTEMTDVTDYTGDAMDLYTSARTNGDGSSVATMFWLGYDTPEGAVDWDTVTSGRAEDGGQRLADAVDGLRASRTTDAHMTAIGHSYGSVATSYAATDHGLKVDDIALIGSPGAGPADNASEFSVGRDHVYAGRNSNDLVSALSTQGWVRNPLALGVDPASEDFGATRFEAESTDRNHIRDIANHSRYYDVDSESLYNLGRIVDGHGSDVNVAAQTYDPWWGPVQDPEIDRDVTSGEEGRSNTDGLRN